MDVFPSARFPLSYGRGDSSETIRFVLQHPDVFVRWPYGRTRKEFFDAGRADFPSLSRQDVLLKSVNLRPLIEYAAGEFDFTSKAWKNWRDREYSYYSIASQTMDSKLGLLYADISRGDLYLSSAMAFYFKPRKIADESADVEEKLILPVEDIRSKSDIFKNASGGKPIEFFRKGKRIFEIYRSGTVFVFPAGDILKKSAPETERDAAFERAADIFKTSEKTGTLDVWK